MTIRIAAAAAVWLATIAGASAAELADAKIKLFQFQPTNLEIATGTIVKWVNGDDIEHSVTAGAPGQESGAFDSGFFKKGGSFEHSFDRTGTFTYFCKRHPSMKAAVTVK